MMSDETKAAYIRWLEAQNFKDEMDRKNGLSPLPRSKQEKEAMFSVLPLAERRRIKWQKRQDEIEFK